MPGNPGLDGEAPVQPVGSSRGRREERAQTPKEPAPIELIRELNRFCVYEIEDSHEAERPPVPPAASADLVRFDQDCAALATVGGAKKSTADWQALSTEFLGQAGKTKLPRIDGPPGVRLAFLDTHPTGRGVPKQWWHSEHGYTLAHIARNLVCLPKNAERCAAQITTRLALPILRFDSKTKGYSPMRNEEDTSACRAISPTPSAGKWTVGGAIARGGPQHLVLNLSLAWDGDLFGGLDETQVLR